MVRVSGPDATAVAAQAFRGFPAEGPMPRKLYAGRLIGADGATLDHGLAVLMPAPASYTGEDVLELHCHGGVLVSRTVLASALAAGARGAERGEFTLRAFLNGKLDLTQAESVVDLINARSQGAMRHALGQFDGELSSAVERLRERIVGIAAHLEAAIDFSDEDIGPSDGGKLVCEARFIRDELCTLAATFERGRILRDGLRVAIVGKPNVGKSSLLNRLLEEERAIVTPIPGTTRDVIEESVEISGVALVLTDTAGIRQSRDEVERIGIERSYAQVEAADLAIVVLDASRMLDENDLTILTASRHKRRILLLNKKDLEQLVSMEELLGEANGCPIVSASMRSGVGLEDLEELKHAIIRSVGLELGDTSSLIVTRERHRAALQAAASSLDLASQALDANQPPDLVAVDVMHALDHVGEIVGLTSSEAVLDHIFKEFCIGK